MALFSKKKKAAEEAERIRQEQALRQEEEKARNKQQELRRQNLALLEQETLKNGWIWKPKKWSDATDEAIEAELKKAKAVHLDRIGFGLGGKCFEHGFQIVEMRKYKLPDLIGLQSHMLRLRSSRTNPDIRKKDQDKNRVLINPINDTDKKSFQQAALARIAEGAKKTRTIRKDAVACCGFIVTSDEKTVKSWPPERQQAFFMDAVQYFKDKYGEKNVLYATVHYDETTPHLHLGLVPILDERLCAKDLFNRSGLTDLHDTFWEQVGQKYGLKRGDGHTGQHVDPQKLKQLQKQKQQQKQNATVRSTVSYRL